MSKILYYYLLLLTIPAFADGKTSSPLAKYSNTWNGASYQACNTAAAASYLTENEKQVVYILNLVRQYPQLFAQTVLKAYPDESGGAALRQSGYYKSLMSTLNKMQPEKMLHPDLIAYASADCHATSSGKSGYVGHQRQTGQCKAVQNFNGECCDYSNGGPLDIVLNLLIDEGIESLWAPRYTTGQLFCHWRKH